jgi:hypothetical protein
MVVEENRSQKMSRRIRNFSIVLAAALSTSCGHQEGATATAASAQSPASAANETAAEQASTSTSHADGAILDACSLVSKADAEGILATPAKRGEHATDDKHASHCQYDAANQDTSGYNSLSVEIHNDEDVKEATTGFEIHQKLYENSNAGAVYTYEVLTGIGDGAFLVTNKVPENILAKMPAMIQDQQMLFVVKGAKDIEVNTSYMGKPRLADNLKALAKKLAEHL